MRELGLLAAVVAGLYGVQVLSNWPWQLLLRIGASIAIAGLIVGLPLMAAYHGSLYRFLRRQGIDDPQWYRHPLRYNDALRAAGDRRTRWLSWTAGAGFVAIMLGLGVVVLAWVAGADQVGFGPG